jgi:predicted RNA-binding protein with PUA-like domain
MVISDDQLLNEKACPNSNKLLKLFLQISNDQIRNQKFLPMNYWLIKSEPFKYSWEQFVKDGQTFWDGVRNYAARNHLRAMKKGDLVFWYHSNEGTEIVGIAKVVKEAYQDPTTAEEAWVAVDFKPHKKLKKPVGLAQIKTDQRLSNMALVRLGRLSVQPVTEEEWKIVMEMAGE